LAVILAEAILIRTRRSGWNEERFVRTVLALLTLSTAIFASSGFLVISRPSPVALAAGSMLFCASILSNAIMARGWPLATVLSASFPSASLLLAAPVAIFVFHHQIDLTDAIMFQLSAIAVVAFIAIVSTTLAQEGDEMLAARARWRMLFDQSPLPQVHFDASRLHDLVLDARSRPDGAALTKELGSMSRILELLTITDRNSAYMQSIDTEEGVDPLRLDRFDDTLLKDLLSSLGNLTDDGSLPPFEGRMLTAGSIWRDVSVHIRSLPDPQRPWSNCIATIVDMTEVTDAARAQQQAVEAAEAANRAKSEFLAITSHEIRTPLNGVLGMVQAMERGALEPVQRERLGVIRNSGDALLKILNNILDLSKIEAGRVALDVQNFDLETLLTEISAGYQGQATQKGLELTLEARPEARGVYRGDPVRLRQILYNLISNALKFTQQGSIRVSVRKLGDQLEFAVTDTGLGIAPDQIDRLFEKFVQADSSTTRQYDGVGLGLAICRELCRAMGGDVRASSALNRGSCFIVTLPLPRISDPVGLSQASAGPAPDSLSETLRVLVAEDNMVNQMVLRTLLAEFGLTAHFTQNGEEALAAWRDQNWDLILMDVQMPVMDGVAATRIIRREEEATGRPPIPIIAITANAMPHQITTYRQAGMSAHVSKPIDLAQLYAVIASQCDTPSTAGQNPQQNTHWENPPVAAIATQGRPEPTPGAA
jgi:signal transduction histidine kinase/FixJ family two-component response regulator